MAIYKISLDRLEETMECYKTQREILSETIGYADTTVGNLSPDIYAGTDAVRLKTGIKEQKQKMLEPLENLMDGTEQRLRDALYWNRTCKAYCQQFEDILDGSMVLFTGSGEEITGYAYCHQEKITSIRQECEEVKNSREKIEKGMEEIRELLSGLRKVTFDYETPVGRIEEGCRKLERIEDYARGLWTYSFHMEQADSNLSQGLSLLAAEYQEINGNYTSQSFDLSTPEAWDRAIAAYSKYQDNFPLSVREALYAEIRRIESIPERARSKEEKYRLYTMELAKNGFTIEENTACLASTMMYLDLFDDDDEYDYRYAEYKKNIYDGMTMGDLLELMDRMAEEGVTCFTDPDGGNNSRYYYAQILRDAVEKNPYFKDMKIGNFSRTMEDENGEPSYNEGTNAMTYTEARTGTVYVAFRGTSGREWIENGRRFNVRNKDDLTVQMEQVADYMNRVAKENQWNGNSQVILTGHSQGGNDAQLAMLLTETGGYAKACYSFDGQGHSKQLLESLKKSYGEEEYNRRVSNMYSICGDNDFVNCLGESAFKKENIKYVECHNREGATNGQKIIDYHDIRSMFCDEDGNYGAVTNTCLNVERGKASYMAENLWKQVEQMPDDMREHVQNGIMQVAQIGAGKSIVGVNGEVMSLMDARTTLAYGLGAIAEAAAVTEIEQSSLLTPVKESMSALTQMLWDWKQELAYGRYIQESMPEYIGKLLEIAFEKGGEVVAGEGNACFEATTNFWEGIYAGASGLLDGSREPSEMGKILKEATQNAVDAAAAGYKEGVGRYEQFIEDVEQFKKDVTMKVGNFFENIFWGEDE